MKEELYYLLNFTDAIILDATSAMECDLIMQVNWEFQIQKVILSSFKLSFFFVFVERNACICNDFSLDSI